VRFQAREPSALLSGERSIFGAAAGFQVRSTFFRRSLSGSSVSFRCSAWPPQRFSCTPVLKVDLPALAVSFSLQLNKTLPFCAEDQGSVPARRPRLLTLLSPPKEAGPTKSNGRSSGELRSLNLARSSVTCGCLYPSAFHQMTRSEQRSAALRSSLEPLPKLFFLHAVMERRSQGIRVNVVTLRFGQTQPTRHFI